MSHRNQFNTTTSQHHNYIQLWFHDSVAPDTRKVMEEMAEMIVKLEETLVDLCLNNNVGMYIRGEKNAGLSLIRNKEDANECYKEIGQWMTSNEACG